MIIWTTRGDPDDTVLDVDNLIDLRFLGLAEFLLSMVDSRDCDAKRLLTGSNASG
jgi:hypothetical protein